jgi:hypothetical protein
MADADGEIAVLRRDDRDPGLPELVDRDQTCSLRR